MRKLIISLAVTVFTAVSILSVYKIVQNMSKSDYHIPTVEEIGIPDKMNQLSFGMYYVQADENEEDGYSYHDITKEKVELDLDKPIKIHTHGMNASTGYHEELPFREADSWDTHNIFMFRWSPFADNADPMILTRFQWSSTWGTTYAYPDENGRRVVEKDEPINYSIAEIYAAYYYHLMKAYDFTTNDIHFTGHSMGGMLTVALASYLVNMMDMGILEKEFMPSRFTLLDPYVDCIDYRNSPIDWQEEPIGKNGGVELFVRTANQLKEYGIPLEYVRSGFVHMAVLGGGEYSLQDIEENLVHIILDIEHLRLKYPTLGDYGSHAHQEAVLWYLKSKKYDMFDKATDFTSYAFSANTPFEYCLSMTGHQFEMEMNYDSELDEDVMFSTNKKTGIVCGYAFVDENGNGKHDETLASKKAGMDVSLYAEGELIGTTTTNKGGYYEFSVPEKYASKNLEVRVDTADLLYTTVGEGETDNKIGDDGRYEFTLQHKLQTVLVNVGLKSYNGITK